MPRYPSLGFTASRFDGRDWEFRAAEWASSAPRGPGGAIRLRDSAAVFDQRAVPCCTSCAVAACMQIVDARHQGWTRLSPLYHYYALRRGGSDLEAFELREALEAATEVGFSALDLHDPPFDARGAQRRPSEAG